MNLRIPVTSTRGGLLKFGNKRPNMFCFFFPRFKKNFTAFSSDFNLYFCYPDKVSFDSFSTQNINLKYTKDVSLELLWSIFPLIILLLLIGPSLGLLYSNNLLKICEPFKPFLTLKIVGSMWYWNYQYPATFCISYDFGAFDSYLINNIIKSDSGFSLEKWFIYRNLIVDEILTLPTFKYIRLLITSQDTIHSWAIPSLAIKVDACPGRLNQIYLHLLREGFFFGQCSELCGVNHAFMPINLRSIKQLYTINNRLYEIM